MSENGESFGAAESFLSDLDPDFATLIRQVGACRLLPESRLEPYQALLRAIAHQQLHGRAAEAIFKRFLDLYPDTVFPSAQQIRETEENVLRACGLSASKVLAFYDIADKSLSGIVPSTQEAQVLADEELIARLTAVRGVGRWTVQIFLMFNLGRLDVLPVDDFGLQEGWRLLKRLPERPKPRELALAGEAWRPYRSTAAWYLWRAVEWYKTSNDQVAR